MYVETNLFNLIIITNKKYENQTTTIFISIISANILFLPLPIVTQTDHTQRIVAPQLVRFIFDVYVFPLQFN